MNPIILLLLLPVILGMVLLSLVQSDRRRQFVEQRLTKMTVGENSSEPATLSLVRRLHATSPNVVFRLFGARLDAAFEAAGNRVGLLHLLIAALFSAIIVIGFASRILGLNPGLVTVLGVVAAAVTPVLFLRLAQSHYRNRFLDVFPDGLDLVARAVKAGLPVNEALVTAGREIADPVGSELRRALDQMQIGVQMIDALQQVASRIRVADFRFLVVALALQQRTGGSLAETLGNLSTVIRGRKALRLKARSLSSEAKASAAVLALLPFAVGGAMYLLDRDMAMTLLVDARGRFMVGMAVLSLVTGLSTMAVLVRRALR
jgi:tight adherence protein B